MKIMRIVDKKVGDVYYYKYRVTLPKDSVRDSKLFGKELITKTKEGKIIIEAKN